MIQIKFNGEWKEVRADEGLSDFLLSVKIPSKGIAVAINQNIVPKQLWNETSLQQNDELLIIKATQGG